MHRLTSIWLTFALSLTACASPPPAPTPTALPPTAPAPAAPPDQQYLVLDRGRSSVSYVVEQTILNEANRLAVVIGQTNVITGALTLDRTNPAASQLGTFSVDLSSLQSDNADRDAALRDQWLESARFPLATFVVRRLAGFPEQPREGEPARFQVLGDLTIREATRPVTWDVTALARGEMLSGQALTQLKLTDFGVQPPQIANLLVVQDVVTITVSFVFLPTQ